MEPFSKMMTQFIEMQQKTQNFWQDAFKNSNEMTEDYLSILDNSIKFNQAAVDYHNSVIKMIEAIKDTQQVLSKKKK